MKEIRVKGLGVSLIIILCMFFIAFLYPTPYTLHPILATESSSSASSSADIKSKLKSLQEEIASRAAGMKNEVTKKLQNKAYVGILQSKDDNSLILSVKGSPKNVNISEFTEYIIKSKTYIGNQGLKNISAENVIACLGDIDDKGTLTAKRIVKLDSPLPNFPKIVHGVIASISDGKTKLQTSQKDQFLLSFDKKTTFQLGKNEGDFNDIRINKWIIITGQASSSANISTNSAEIKADYVYIFPNSLTKPKISTPSAIPSENLKKKN